MLVSYFLKRFVGAFSLFFVALLFVFAFGDLLVRLATLPSFFSLPIIFMYLLPLMALFAFPIASSLAVQLVVGNLYLHDEVIFFQFFRGARRRLHGAVLIFSCMLSALFIPLVLNVAPTSYWKAKNYIINSVKEQFEHLKPHTFHNVVPSFTFYFKERESTNGTTYFKNVLLSIKDNEGAHYFITAKQCYLDNLLLIIEHGSLQNRAQDKWYVGEFEQTEIDLKNFIADDKNGQRQVKFLTMSELVPIMKSDHHAYVEYHKRIAQILWQFLFPLLALWGMLVIGQKKSNILVSILLSGSLFIYSYVGLSMAQALSKYAFAALMVLYGCSSIALLAFFFLYKRKW